MYCFIAKIICAHERRTVSKDCHQFADCASERERITQDTLLKLCGRAQPIPSTATRLRHAERWVSATDYDYGKKFMRYGRWPRGSLPLDKRRDARSKSNVSQRRRALTDIFTLVPEVSSAEDHHQPTKSFKREGVAPVTRQSVVVVHANCDCHSRQAGEECEESE